MPSSFRVHQCPPDALDAACWLNREQRACRLDDSDDTALGSLCVCGDDNGQEEASQEDTGGYFGRMSSGESLRTLPTSFDTGYIPSSSGAQG